jgi:hypothetical protein
MALLDFIRQIEATKNFNLQDKFEFVEFNDVSYEEIQEKNEFPETLEIWARVNVPYTGNPPESYKVLNLMIGDWVEEHLELLTETIHKKLKDHFSENYPDSDTSELDSLDETVIWTDQLDYMPEDIEDKKTMDIEIELVLHGEPLV